MIIKDIERAIKVAKNFYELANYGQDSLSEADVNKHTNLAYNPIKEAIANNDQTVIAFIEASSKEDREVLYAAMDDGIHESKAINEGVVREGYERAVNLHKSMQKDFGIITRNCF